MTISIDETTARRDATLPRSDNWTLIDVPEIETLPKAVFLRSQNLAARNTVAPYSVRGLDIPRVSTPLTWEEVAALRPDHLEHPAALARAGHSYSSASRAARRISRSATSAGLVFHRS